eukprot:gene206-11060_t
MGFDSTPGVSVPAPPGVAPGTCAPARPSMGLYGFQSHRHPTRFPLWGESGRLTKALLPAMPPKGKRQKKRAAPSNDQPAKKRAATSSAQLASMPSASVPVAQQWC